MIRTCVTFEQMVRAAFAGEIIYVRSYRPRDRKTRNNTDLPLRLKAAGKYTTPETCQDMYRPHLVSLPLPLLGLCLTVMPLVLPTGKFCA